MCRVGQICGLRWNRGEGIHTSMWFIESSKYTGRNESFKLSAFVYDEQPKVPPPLHLGWFCTRRSWGPRATSSINSSRRVQTNALTSGEAAMQTESGFPWRSYDRLEQPLGRTSSLFTGCRCWTWWRGDPRGRRWRSWRDKWRLLEHRLSTLV